MIRALFRKLFNRRRTPQESVLDREAVSDSRAVVIMEGVVNRLVDEFANEMINRGHMCEQDRGLFAMQAREGFRAAIERDGFLRSPAFALIKDDMPAYAEFFEGFAREHIRRQANLTLGPPRSRN